MPRYVGMEGDLLDALVLGPRLPLGARLRVRAWGAVTLTDRGMQDDKLVCGDRPVTAIATPGRAAVLPLLRAVQGAPEPLAAPPRAQRVRGLARRG